MQTRSVYWVAPVALSVALVAPCSAFAVDYLSAAQAQSALFPAASSWQEQNLLLTSDQVLQLGKKTKAVWRLQHALDSKGKRLGTVVIDQVIGKFEFITYAVGVDNKNNVVGVEILSYRESHGSEIRLPAWRKQFVGKNSRHPIQTGEDIAIISGATLSCNHVTDGIRRIAALLATVDQ